MLYTDEDETILVAQRPIILNGIEDMAARSDLLDRGVILDMLTLSEEKRRDEEVVWAEFGKVEPRILGALLDAVSVALREIKDVKEKCTRLPRMADFAQWVIAAESALGLTPGAFMRAYSENRADANLIALESSPVVNALLEMLQRNPVFERKSEPLLEELSIGQNTRIKGWPGNPRVLSGILNRLAPNLRAVGVAIEQCKGKVWRIELPKDSPERKKYEATQADVARLRADHARLYAEALAKHGFVPVSQESQVSQECNENP